MTTANSVASSARLGDRRGIGRPAKTRISGVIVMALVKSPVHQVIQTGAYHAQSTVPATACAVVPMVAQATVAGTAAKNTYLTMFSARSKVRRPPANRVARNVPKTASSVFPTAIAPARGAESDVVRFTRNAPASTAGQMRYPSISIPASARPVGGQMAEVVALISASERPSFPARK